MRLLPVLFLATTAAVAQEVPHARETITVERILVDVRVTEGNGDAILGLTPKDFRVRVDGKLAKVESAEWIPDTAAGREIAAIDQPPTSPTKSLDPLPPAGRLLVFLFQRDFGAESSRITGQMKILNYANEFIDSLDPEDRVAVLSFDSHLKFRLDFSDDHEKIRQAMREALRTDEPPRPPLAPSPSLGNRLDAEQLRKAAQPEVALLIIGNALRPIPGPKSLILFGWGLGRLAGDRIMMDHRYTGAQYALESARTTVYSLDITQANWHSLGAGLAKPAQDTGGFYASTYEFPQFAIDRLQKTLVGHYELEVRKPDLKTIGAHEIEVEVIAHRNAVVLSRRTYIDKE